jgi:hypothetical protein
VSPILNRHYFIGLRYHSRQLAIATNASSNRPNGDPPYVATRAGINRRDHAIAAGQKNSRPSHVNFERK